MSATNILLIIFVLATLVLPLKFIINNLVDKRVKKQLQKETVKQHAIGPEKGKVYVHYHARISFFDFVILAGIAAAVETICERYEH